MSKILFACLRNSQQTSFSPMIFEMLSKRLEPDNISFHPPQIIDNNGVVIALFNPNNSTLVYETSVCLGQMIDADDEWWKPGHKIPDGSFAIFRSDEEHVEIASDVVATRTVWYYLDDDIFVASSSQRAIVFLLKSFEFNRAVIPWILSAGLLGPGHSWDSRIKFLRGDSSLHLDRSSWTLTVRSRECRFNPAERPEKAHYDKLMQALQESMTSLNLDFSKWVLPLSGGYDSRGILCFLKDHRDLKCVTWGLESSQHEKHNDAFVAKQVAEHFNKKHTYYPTDFSDEPVEVLFHRFLICGEGRIDHIGAYMDGFSIWRNFFSEGIDGVIRGDEVFGCSAQPSELDVRIFESFPLLSDFANLKNLHEYGIEGQELPDWARRRDDESLEDWRDRMSHEIELPYFLAALNDLKLPYVEVINPLLTRKIVSVIRELPADLRTNKILYTKIVDDIGPKIPYAKHAAIASTRNLLKKKTVRGEISRELNTESARSVLPAEFIGYVLDKIRDTEEPAKMRGSALKQAIKRRMPRKMQSLLRQSVVKPTLSFHVLAFRCYVLSAMNRMFTDDARALD